MTGPLRRIAATVRWLSGSGPQPAPFDAWAEGYGTRLEITIPADRSPHRDPLVLHAPGECPACAAFGAVQANRLHAHVRYTGHPEPPYWAPCPSEAGARTGPASRH